MAKEWILNQSNMRWGLTRKKKVGAVMKEIRKCSPKTLAEWKAYYLKEVYPKEHLVDLGKALYKNISDTVIPETENINEQDCINFIENLVINRTFQGYETEIKVIYGQIQKILKVEIKEASDEWDRLYNVDYFIQVKHKYIGLQIKPLGVEGDSDLQIIKEKIQQAKTFEKFTEKYGGKVFYIFSIEVSKDKKIANPEVIEQIRSEIARLSN
jgi:hypothetical protein